MLLLANPQIRYHMISATPKKIDVGDIKIELHQRKPYTVNMIRYYYIFLTNLDNLQEISFKQKFSTKMSFILLELKKSTSGCFREKWMAFRGLRRAPDLLLTLTNNLILKCHDFIAILAPFHVPEHTELLSDVDLDVRGKKWPVSGSQMHILALIMKMHFCTLSHFG